MCAYIIYFAYISKQSQYLNNKKIYKHIERMLIKKNSDDFVQDSLQRILLA